MSEPLTAFLRSFAEADLGPIVQEDNDAIDRVFWYQGQAKSLLATLDAARPSGYPPADPGAQHDDASEWFAARDRARLRSPRSDAGRVYAPSGLGSFGKQNLHPDDGYAYAGCEGPGCRAALDAARDRPGHPEDKSTGGPDFTPATWPEAQQREACLFPGCSLPRGHRSPFHEAQQREGAG